MSQTDLSPRGHIAVAVTAVLVGLVLLLFAVEHQNLVDYVIAVLMVPVARRNVRAARRKREDRAPT